ncbi:MAG: YIP1 family protein [Thermohalobaculum sp.]|nr:YIP1 family protein [Thermohalobaculum sp.]
MIRDLLARMIEGLFQPAASARRILAANHGVDTAMLFVVLAYAVQAIIQILLPGARNLPEGVEQVPVTLHLLNIIIQAMVIGVLSLMVFGAGRIFGGTGSRKQAFVIVAWHTLVTTLLSPVFLFGMAQIAAGQPVSPVVLVLLVVTGSFWLWVLAVYTAVLHGFRNPWGVLGVMLGISFLVSALLMSMVPAP